MFTRYSSILNYYMYIIYYHYVNLCYQANTLWMGTVLELSKGLDSGYDFSSVRDFLFGGGAPRAGEVENLQERMPTLQNIMQCMNYIFHIAIFRCLFFYVRVGPM